MTDEHPSWSVARIRAEVEPLRERARSTATLVLTFTTAVLGGLAVNARTATLTDTASLIATVGAGILAAGVFGLLVAATTNIVDDEVDPRNPLPYIEQISGKIASWTRWSLRIFGVALGLLVFATAWDQLSPGVERVRVVLDESVATSIAPCDGIAPVLVGNVQSSELDDPGAYLTINDVTAPCDEWREPSGSARNPTGSVVAVLPASAERSG